MDDQTKGMCLLSGSPKNLRMNKNWKRAQVNMHLQTFNCCDHERLPKHSCTILFINDIALKQYTVWAWVPSGIVQRSTAPGLQGSMSDRKTTDSNLNNIGILDKWHSVYKTVGTQQMLLSFLYA